MERVLNGKPRRAGWPIDEQIGDGGDSPAWSRKRGHTYQPLDVRTGRLRRSPYAELHAHSAYSFLDGASTPEELVEEAARLDLRAIALTDHDGLYGVVRFAEAAKELRCATVFGAELSLGNVARTEEPDPPGPHLLVLARGPEGYRRLSRELAGRTWPAARRASRATTTTRSPRRRAGTGTSSPDAAKAMSARHFRGRPGSGRGGAGRPGGPVRPRSGQHRAHPPRPSVSTTNATPPWPGWRRRFGVGVVATTAAHFAEPSRGRLAMAMGAIRARNSMDEAAGWLAPLGGSHLRSGEEMARLFAQFSRGR